jgi:hypothetical protein
VMLGRWCSATSRCRSHRAIKELQSRSGQAALGLAGTGRRQRRARQARRRRRDGRPRRGLPHHRQAGSAMHASARSKPRSSRGSRRRRRGRPQDAADARRRRGKLERRSFASASWPASRASTAATRPTVRPITSRSACCRVPTARRCSRAARRRRWSSRRSAPVATRRSSMRSKASGKEPFMLHYNFPPFSVGETGMMAAPKRREIGHGNLARRGVAAVMPDMSKFPYVLRVVSEILESNGSSSMASSAAPARADGRGRADQGAGRRRRDGLVKEGDALRRHHRHPRRRGSPRRHGLQGGRHAPASPRCRWTSRSTASRKEIMETALEQAREGRLHILGEMNKVLRAAREDVRVGARRSSR